GLGLASGSSTPRCARRTSACSSPDCLHIHRSASASPPAPAHLAALAVPPPAAHPTASTSIGRPRPRLRLQHTSLRPPYLRPQLTRLPPHPSAGLGLAPASSTPRCARRTSACSSPDCLHIHRSASASPPAPAHLAALAVPPPAAHPTASSPKSSVSRRAVHLSSAASPSIKPASPAGRRPCGSTDQV